MTIGEALEATALSIGGKPVEQSDASAIQAAEARATGTNEVQPGGVAATAQSAATYNASTMFEGGKTKISDVLEVIFESLSLIITSSMFRYLVIISEIKFFSSQFVLEYK